MCNLIKMDLYRLFKTRALAAGLIISAVFSGIIILGIAGIGILVRTIAGGDDSALLFLGDIVTWSEGVSFFTILYTGLTKMSLLVVCVLTAIYVSEEQISGYVKNVAGQTNDKGIMIFSKFAAIAVLTLLVFIAYCLGAAIVGVIFFHKNMTMDMMGSFFSAVFVKYLLYIAIGAIMIFLCTVTKNKSLAIAIGVIFGTGITGIAYTIVEMFFSFVLKINFRISSIMPDGWVAAVNMDSGIDTLLKGSLAAVICAVIFLSGSYIVMKKRDTR